MQSYIYVKEHLYINPPSCQLVNASLNPPPHNSKRNLEVPNKSLNEFKINE